MIICRGESTICTMVVVKAHTVNSSVSIEGFWAHGLGKEGTLTVGEDEDGA